VTILNKALLTQRLNDVLRFGSSKGTPLVDEDSLELLPNSSHTLVTSLDAH
jgi:hypothetical protein